MRVPLLIAVVLLTRLANAQAGRGVTVSGVVRDSTVGAPLAGALVQILADSVSAVPRTVVADSTGRYRIDGVTRGRYLIQFIHPMLDSLTLEPILKAFTVAGDRPMEFDLGIPSGRQLRPLFCGAQAARNSGGAFVGIVRDARDGKPIQGVSVVAEWVDLVIGRGGMGQRPSRLAAVTQANGWFALCGIPAPGSVSVHARRGTDTTDLIEISMPDGGFARRDFYVGASTTGASGRLSGRVVNERGGTLAGAIVGLPRGPQTRTDGAGEWTLSNLPPGTRMLEVRAIGYYPVRRAVDVVPDAPSVHVALSTFESVLDTVRIRATGIGAADQGAFEQRRRAMGMGRFISDADIQKRNPTETSDIFKSIPGVYVGDEIKMRNAFASAVTQTEDCKPAFFIDGVPVAIGSTGALDGWISPQNILAIEIYPDVPPPQFQVALSGCGSIVIWSKRRSPARKPPS